MLRAVVRITEESRHSTLAATNRLVGADTRYKSPIRLEVEFARSIREKKQQAARERRYGQWDGITGWTNSSGGGSLHAAGGREYSQQPDY